VCLPSFGAWVTSLKTQLILACLMLPLTPLCDISKPFDATYHITKWHNPYTHLTVENDLSPIGVEDASCTACIA
jgi:hypothetical protein